MYIVTPVGKLPVYLAHCVGPGVSEMRSKERHIWVHTNSVMHSDGKVIHPLNIYKLLAMWDYEGK